MFFLGGKNFSEIDLVSILGQEENQLVKQDFKNYKKALHEIGNIEIVWSKFAFFLNTLYTICASKKLIFKPTRLIQEIVESVKNEYLNLLKKTNLFDDEIIDHYRSMIDNIFKLFNIDIELCSLKDNAE